MDDLIDRDNFIDRKLAVDTVLGLDKEYYDETLLMKVAIKLTGLPKADTERHAHWTRINDVLSQCSNCKTTILRCDTDNYCSNCGCKMDEVQE